MKFHTDGSAPIFVYGSNLAGRHGAGAAKAAYFNYGAKYGHGDGLAGVSYGIPTKDENIDTMPLDQIKPYVDKFLVFARANPKLLFVVSQIGCGLAGYSPDLIAPMFKGAPDNCSFAEEWAPFL